MLKMGQVTKGVGNQSKRLAVFQALSVEHIVRAIGRKPKRFLLADEVGLGKTEVARAVIGELHRRWKKRKNSRNKPFVVLYVCSNLGLIEQNLNRLFPASTAGSSGDDASFDSPRRATLLSLYWNAIRRQNGKVVIIPITPGTFFVGSNRYGTKRERALLFRLLKQRRRGQKVPKWWRGNNVGKDSFERELDHVDQNLVRRLPINLKKAIDHDIGLQDRRPEDDDQIPVTALIRMLNRSNRKKDRRHFAPMVMARLRALLAQESLNGLDVQLVIFDEFQRFKDQALGQHSSSDGPPDSPSTLISDSSDDAHLRSLLVDRHRLLLLSATPYTLMDTDTSGSHREDFYRLLRFLFQQATPGKSTLTASDIRTRVDAYDAARKDFVSKTIDSRGSALPHAIPVATELWKAKVALEDALKKVLLRTERTFYERQIADLLEHDDGRSPDDVSISREFAQAYQSLYKLLKQDANKSTILDWWRSGSHWLSVMDKNQYATIERALRRLKQFDELEQRHLFYSLDDLKGKARSYENPRIVRLKGSLFPTAKPELWVSPTLPYWGNSEQSVGNGKALVFSGWRFVPRQLALELSLAAASQLETSLHGEESRSEALDLYKDRRFSLAPMRVLYPSVWLSNTISPEGLGREAQKSLGGSNASTLAISELVRSMARERIRAALVGKKGVTIGDKTKSKGRSLQIGDVLFFLDKEYLNTREFRQTIAKLMRAKKPKQLRQLGKIISKRIPSGVNINVKLLDELTDIALGSPAVLLLRSLKSVGLARIAEMRTRKTAGEALADLLFTMIEIFQPYFSKRYVSQIIRKDDPGSRQYLPSMLNYCHRHHLQAVLDEYIFLLRRQAKSADELGVWEEVREALVSVLGLQQGRILVKLSARNKDRMICRLHFARSFNDLESDDSEKGTAVEGRDNLREAFNSPFWPMCLVTTAVGQEGLDFHRYCNHVVHWNLSPNPVDFEQREGRIQRYNSLLVRQGLAQFLGERAKHEGRLILETPRDTRNIWEKGFQEMTKDWSRPQRFAHGLFPHWISGTTPVQRSILAFKYGRDTRRYESLLRQVALYRVVLGQRSQRARLTDLEKDLSPEEIDQLAHYALRLSPIDRGVLEKIAKEEAQQILQSEDPESQIVSLLSLVKETLQTRNIPPLLATLVSRAEQLAQIDTTAALKLRAIASMCYFVNPFDEKPDLMSSGFDDDITMLTKLLGKSALRHHAKLIKSAHAT